MQMTLWCLPKANAQQSVCWNPAGSTEKSKVTSIFAQKNFKFLGFCLGKNGNGIFIRAHRKSLDKAKKTLKLLTKRNRGRNVRRVMQEVKVFIRGWIGYF